MARPQLAYFSASETAWFGVEHLNLGYRDFDRLPDRRDGVFFTRPFEEGKPGMQPERIPPYVTTLNPGWDPAPAALQAAADVPRAEGGNRGDCPVFAPAKMGLSPSATLEQNRRPRNMSTSRLLATAPAGWPHVSPPWAYP